MSEKRKDSKGRVLRTGENQRADGRYQYRYPDIKGDRRTVHDWDLHALRDNVYADFDFGNIVSNMRRLEMMK